MAGQSFHPKDWNRMNWMISKKNWSNCAEELGLTEGRSTGIPKIRRKLKQNGSPPPLFETDDNLAYFLTVLLPHPGFVEEKTGTAKSEPVNETVNGTVNQTQEQILREMEKENSVTYGQLAQRLRKGRSTIYRNIKKLLEGNIIKRFGSDKNGYRQVNRVA